MNEADLGLSTYDELFHLIRELEELTETTVFQYIVTTTTRPPDDLRGRTAGRTEDRGGHFLRPSDGLLAGALPLTGISDRALLRASHIIPWSKCENDAERLDVHNGLLLSALWDAAFDRALVTFDDQGRPEFSTSLSEQARTELRWHFPISLTDEHRRRLARHRERARLAKEI